MCCCRVQPAAASALTLSVFALACLGLAAYHEIKCDDFSGFGVSTYTAASAHVVLSLALAAGKTTTAWLRWTAASALLVLAAPITVFYARTPWRRTSEGCAAPAVALVYCLMASLLGFWVPRAVEAFWAPMDPRSGYPRRVQERDFEDELQETRPLTSNRGPYVFGDAEGRGGPEPSPRRVDRFRVPTGGAPHSFRRPAERGRAEDPLGPSLRAHAQTTEETPRGQKPTLPDEGATYSFHECTRAPSRDVPAYKCTAAWTSGVRANGERFFSQFPRGPSEERGPAPDPSCAYSRDEWAARRKADNRTERGQAEPVSLGPNGAAALLRAFTSADLDEFHSTGTAGGKRQEAAEAAVEIDDMIDLD